MLKLILFDGEEFVTIVGRSSDIGRKFPYSVSLDSEIQKSSRKFKTSGEMLSHSCAPLMPSEFKTNGLIYLI